MAFIIGMANTPTTSTKLEHWHPQWYDGKLSYWKDTRAYHKDIAYTNEVEWVIIKGSQLITWGFKLKSNLCLPPFIVQKIQEHSKRNPTN